MSRVTDRAAMIAGMSPELIPGDWAFVTDPRPKAEVPATIREAEGLSAIVSVSDAPANAPPMRQITLRVHSSLEGGGLTAAVAQALAEADIACNMVAGHHHDHAFVPARHDERAMQVLRALSAG
ncbi:MAG: ACT domain-containing protein [Pseudomonadota bacterium]